MSSYWNYMPHHAKVKIGFAPERNALVKKLKESENDLTLCIIASAAGGRTKEQLARVEEAEMEVARIITRLEEITRPKTIEEQNRSIDRRLRTFSMT